MDDAVLGCERGEGESLMLEGDCIQYYYGLQGSADELVALVVLQGWPDIESLNAPEVPKFEGGALSMDDDAAVWRSHGCNVEVVWAIDAFPC